MSSPNLNNLIILGSIIVYMSIIADGLTNLTNTVYSDLNACQVNLKTHGVIDIAKTRQLTRLETLPEMTNLDIHALQVNNHQTHQPVGFQKPILKMYL